jgi:hypothetical protein
MHEGNMKKSIIGGCILVLVVVGYVYTAYQAFLRLLRLELVKHGVVIPHYRRLLGDALHPISF